MSGCASSASTTSFDPLTRFTTPGGKSTSSSSSKARFWLMGHRSEGLTT